METLAEPMQEAAAQTVPVKDVVTEQVLDFLEQQIPRLSAAAVDVAYWHALASGLAVLVSGDGGIYHVFPDGKQMLVKALEKRLSMPVGTRVQIP